MQTIQEPDLEWFSNQPDSSCSQKHRKTPNATAASNDRDEDDDIPDNVREGRVEAGVYGIWSGWTIDGWVGREGPLLRDALGGAKGGRVKVLDGVPHAFCLSQSPRFSVSTPVYLFVPPSFHLSISSWSLALIFSSRHVIVDGSHQLIEKVIVPQVNRIPSS